MLKICWEYLRGGSGHYMFLSSPGDSDGRWELRMLLWTTQWQLTGYTKNTFRSRPPWWLTDENGRIGNVSWLDMDSLEDWVALVKTENIENFLNTFQTLITLQHVVSSKPNMSYKSTNLGWQLAKKSLYNLKNNSLVVSGKLYSFQKLQENLTIGACSQGESRYWNSNISLWKFCSYLRLDLSFPFF